MKPNQTESNRNQSKQKKTVYLPEYITLQYTTQYNKQNDPNKKTQSKPKETNQKEP